MAKIIYKRGLSADLPKDVTDGEILVTTDTGEMYIVVKNEKVKISDQEKFELWQKDKKYKAGDMVLAICAEQYSSSDTDWEEYYLAGMQCINDQDPVDVEYPNLMENFSYHWYSVEFNARTSIIALRDGNGKLISDTYATKEEVDTVIGNINTVLSQIVNGGV